MKHGCNIIGGDGGGCCQAHDHEYQKGEFIAKIVADFALFWCFTRARWWLFPIWLIMLILLLTGGTIYWLKYLGRRLFGWFPKKA